ncbi:hypothetical protein HUO13_02725 [Saccharopolyspora erythraea]|uniref:putative T7SS-secreted protein n=1 Tax=Saccharopolyspora erythraea TaxID=1836 RepID=UPI001BA83307|nr:hypothetical protein [Saccharopolyspora erythraea]QUG99860.1 hypothetical protein HUO13_02725 [Saccharopolyspora erythraea]
MSELSPIRGNNLGIAGECDRLTDLANRLEAVGETIRALRADDWYGHARDHYDQAQTAMAGNWLRAADSHRRAATALTDYRLTLEDVQLLADSAIADARESGTRPDVVEIVRSQLDRWRGQLDEAGGRAADAIRTANEELASLRRVLPDLPNPTSPSDAYCLPDGPVPPNQPVATAPAPAEPATVPSPFQALADPASYDRRLTALNAAVLDSWHA